MKSPGHRQEPGHKVREQYLDQRIKVDIAGEVIADSTDVIRLDEDGCPARYYFPRADVRMERLERSDTTTQCPFKGTAHYYSIAGRKGRFDDSVWTYEEPYDEHRELAGRLAFWDDKVPDLHVTAT